MSQRAHLALLQIRNPGDPMAGHEHECFCKAARLEAEQIIQVDAISQGFSQLRLEEYDALLVGGSGEYSVAKGGYPFFEPLLDFLRDVVERDYPTFASCFGFHAIAHALGGQVVTDTDNLEVGTYGVALTSEGQQDQLFSPLDQQFYAQFGHKDRIERLPDRAVSLARGEVIACQAYRIRDHKIWATQFHPELTADDNRHRYRHYVDQYPGAGLDPRIMESFRETVGASELLGRFVEQVLGS